MCILSSSPTSCPTSCPTSSPMSSPTSGSTSSPTNKSSNIRAGKDNSCRAAVCPEKKVQDQPPEESGRPKPRKKHLRFDEETSTLPPSISDSWSHEELRSLWYSKNDFNKFRQDVMTAATIVGNYAPPQHIQASDIINYLDSHEDNCVLGIERLLSTQATRAHIINRQKVVISVLNEQSRQREENECNPMLIAQASISASAWAKEMSRRYARAA